MICLTTPHDFSSLPMAAQGACVTIGNFDGVHMGHQELIRRTLEKAAQRGLTPMVLTFWPHPLTVLAGQRAPALITSQADRLTLLAELGVEVTLEMPFTRNLATLTPHDFVHQVLLPLNCQELVIGYDFSLGKGRAGNFDVLRELGKRNGFGVEQLSPVIVHDAVVSSTRVRDLVRAGDMWELQAVLGRCHHVSGEVVHGFGRGEGLGFPTANVDTGSVLLPRQGVYATWVSLAEPETKAGAAQALSQYQGPWPAVTNVGLAPTFDNARLSVESFLLEGGRDFYGESLRVHFVQRIRDEQRFASVAELKKRISKDVALARGILDTAERH